MPVLSTFKWLSSDPPPLDFPLFYSNLSQYSFATIFFLKEAVLAHLHTAWVGGCAFLKALPASVPFSQQAPAALIFPAVPPNALMKTLKKSNYCCIILQAIATIY